MNDHLSRPILFVVIASITVLIAGLAVLSTMAVFGWLTRPGERQSTSDPYKKYGNWSQVIASASAVLFGLSSLSVATSLYELQRNARQDAALERAARAIQSGHGQQFQELRALEQDYPTAVNKIFPCIVYLKQRLNLAPRWTEKLHHDTSLMDRLQLGTAPSPGVMDQDEQANAQKLYDQFVACRGSDGANLSVELLGIKIARLIYHPLNTYELTLMEWARLRDDDDLRGARDLLVHELVPEICVDENYKDDIFGLFVELRADKTHSKFANAFLTSYPNLDLFLQDACYR